MFGADATAPDNETPEREPGEVVNGSLEGPNGKRQRGSFYLLITKEI
jgi:hypothetical protein